MAVPPLTHSDVHEMYEQELIGRREAQYLLRRLDAQQQRVERRAEPVPLLCAACRSPVNVERAPMNAPQDACDEVLLAELVAHRAALERFASFQTPPRCVNFRTVHSDASNGVATWHIVRPFSAQSTKAQRSSAPSRMYSAHASATFQTTATVRKLATLQSVHMADRVTLTPAQACDWRAIVTHIGV